MSCGRSLSLSVATVFAIIPSLLNGAILEKRPFVLLQNSDHPVNPGLPRLNPNSSSQWSNIGETLQTSSGAKAAAPAAAAILDTPPTLASLAIPMTSIALPEVTAPPPSGSAACTPLTQCRLYYQFVNMYYWPQDSHNSACLPADQQITSVSPDIPNIQSPSVYVVFPSIMAFDGCHQVGKTFTDLTTSFAPEAMSTVRSDWSVHPLNFTDLPCPPADIPWDPSKGPYQPQLAPPHFLFTIDPAFSTCTPAASQGIDPYKPLKTANGGSPPGLGFCIPPRCKRALGPRLRGVSP